MKQETDLDALKKGQPYIRSAAAFLIFLFNRQLVTPPSERNDNWEPNIDDAYRTADSFINRLLKDVTIRSEATR